MNPRFSNSGISLKRPGPMWVAVLASVGVWLGLHSVTSWSGQSIAIESEAGVAAVLRVALNEFRGGTSGGLDGNGGRKAGGAVDGVLTATELRVGATGFAIDKLCRGEIAMVAATRAMRPSEVGDCEAGKIKLLELPLALDALVLVANPRNNWSDRVTVSDLGRAILTPPTPSEGQLFPPSGVTSWRELNPAWPDIAFKPYLPGGNLAVSTILRSALIQARIPQKDGGATPPQDGRIRDDARTSDVLDVIAEGVARDRSAIGVIDLATYQVHAKRLKLLATDDGRKSLATFPVILYVNVEMVRDPGFRAFVDYVLANAPRLVRGGGLEPMSSGVYSEARGRLSGAVAR